MGTVIFRDMKQKSEYMEQKSQCCRYIENVFEKFYYLSEITENKGEEEK